ARNLKILKMRLEGMQLNDIGARLEPPLTQEWARKILIHISNMIYPELKRQLINGFNSDELLEENDSASLGARAELRKGSEKYQVLARISKSIYPELNKKILEYYNPEARMELRSKESEQIKIIA